MLYVTKKMSKGWEGKKEMPQVKVIPALSEQVKDSGCRLRPREQRFSGSAELLRHADGVLYELHPIPGGMGIRRAVRR